MNIEEMNLEEVSARLAEIELEARDASDTEKIKALTEELEKLNERKNVLVELETRKAEAEALNVGKAKADIIETHKEEEKRKMDIKELRNSEQYINAYAEFCKTGDDTECRALMTENVGGENPGTVAIPDFVYDQIKTAWDKNDLLKYVRKVNVAGNLKVQFEISGTDAVKHAEGGAAVTEEELTLGIATIIAYNFKKWISVTDEVMSLRGQSFLNYILAEIAHKLTKEVAEDLIAQVVALTTTATATAPSIAAVSANPAMGTVAKAIASLSDDASQPIIVMNKLTWAEFKAVQYANGYGADPFEGLTVVFENSLPAFSAASAGATYMLVGDFGYGALANLPDGEGIEYKVDDKTLMTSDLVRILGKQYIGVGVVACKAFTQVKKVTVG